jgi:hypothetical protein
MSIFYRFLNKLLKKYKINLFFNVQLWPYAENWRYEILSQSWRPDWRLYMFIDSLKFKRLKKSLALVLTQILFSLFLLKFFKLVNICLKLENANGTIYLICPLSWECNCCANLRIAIRLESQIFMNLSFLIFYRIIPLKYMK